MAGLSLRVYPDLQALFPLLAADSQWTAFLKNTKTEIARGSDVTGIAWGFPRRVSSGPGGMGVYVLGEEGGVDFIFFRNGGRSCVQYYAVLCLVIWWQCMTW